MLGASATGDMVETFQCSSDVSIHRDIDEALLIVPLEVEAEIETALPVYSGLVGAFNNVDLMIGITLGNIFKAQDVHTECEGSGTCAVFPEPGGELH